MKTLFSMIEIISPILSFQNLWGENEENIPLEKTKPTYDQRILYSILLCSYVLLLRAMCRGRNRMQKDEKPKLAPTSTNANFYYSMMTSCVNFFRTKELRIQRLKELLQARKEYGELCEKQIIDIAEINHTMSDLEKDLSVVIKKNDEKLSMLPRHIEDKTRDNDQHSAEHEKVFQQCQQLKNLLTNYPESKVASSIGSTITMRSLDQLLGDMTEIREKIEERTKHHQLTMSYYKELIVQSRQEFTNPSMK